MVDENTPMRSAYEVVRCIGEAMLIAPGLKLKFVAHNTDNADARISFISVNTGSWAFLGNDSFKITFGDATINFAWTEGLCTVEFHEIVMHWLAAQVHEHNHPNRPFEYAYDTIMYELIEVNGFNPLSVAALLDTVARVEHDISVRADPNSLVKYPQPDWFFEEKNGWDNGKVYHMSHGDTVLLRKLHPVDHEIFKRFPVLIDKCSNCKKITEYDHGVYSYLYVEQDDGRDTLWLQSDTDYGSMNPLAFTCSSTERYDCKKVYGNTATVDDKIQLVYERIKPVLYRMKIEAMTQENLNAIRRRADELGIFYRIDNP